jgi:hypothetical protein
VIKKILRRRTSPQAFGLAGGKSEDVIPFIGILRKNSGRNREESNPEDSFGKHMAYRGKRRLRKDPGIHPSTLRAGMYKLGIERPLTKESDQALLIPSMFPSRY